jgi:uncharacterized membrane protein (UPF0127 family)
MKDAGAMNYYYHPLIVSRLSALSILILCVLTVCLLSSVTDCSADPVEKAPLIKTIVILRHEGTDHLPQPLAGFRVEVVAETADKQKGLSGRERLTDDAGMLFVLEPLKPGYFWMKGMNFPIDILFFDQSRRLLAAAENLQPCIRCTVVRPPAGAAYALEIKAGLTEKLDIRKGDRFAFGDE